MRQRWRGWQGARKVKINTEGWELQGAEAEMGNSGGKKLWLARPSPARGTLALAAALEEGYRQPGAWPGAFHSGAWKGNLLSRADGGSGPVPEPGLGDGRGLRKGVLGLGSLESSRQEGESRPMPVGSGQRPLKGKPALPLLKLASFLPSNNPDGVGGWASAFGPRNSRRCPQPTPHCAHSPTAGSGKRSTPGLGPPLGEPAPVAGNRGSGSPAPAAPPPLAPARARRSPRKLRRV